MNTFTLGACFQHELHTGPYFMTFAPRLYCAKVMQTNFDEIPAFLGFSMNFRVKRCFKEISPPFQDAYCSRPREVSNNNLQCMIIPREFSSNNLFLPKLFCDFLNDNSLQFFSNLPFINGQKNHE